MWTEYIFYMLGSGTLLYVFYKWATVNNDYFVKRNIKHIKPTFLVGHTMGWLLRRYTPDEFMNWLYYYFPNERYTN